MASIRRTTALALPKSNALLQHTTTAALLSPLLSCFQQCRAASVLSSLSDTKGAYNKRIRRGRGPASGKGKTSGRGHKGQGQHGKVPFGFNGGQTTDEVVHGKRGFENPLSKELQPLNISKLAHWISTGRISTAEPITIRSLIQSRCLSRAKDGVKLLARKGDTPLPGPVQIVVSRASAAAIDAVEQSGGRVLTRYYSKSSLGRVLRGEAHPYYSLQCQPLGSALGEEDGSATATAAVAGEGSSEETKRKEMDRFKYRLADPVGRKDIEYYRDERHRGYLSHLVPAGEGPSLYFKVPGSGNAGGGAKKTKTKGQTKGTENKVW